MAEMKQMTPTQQMKGDRPLPVGWEWTHVGALGFTITGNTPSKKDETNYGDYLPLVKPPDLLDTAIVDAGDHLSSKGAEFARVLPPESVLVSCIGILGKTGINQIPVAFNQQINAVVPAFGIQSKYVFYFFQSLFARDWLYQLSSATTVAIINKTKFNSIPFPLAPLPEQQRIVAEIETQFTRLDAGIVALKRMQANLKRYKASVLKAACEGRLVPTEAELAQAEGRDYEPADVLLDRILAERRAKWEEQEWQKLIEKAQKKVAQAKRKAVSRPARLSDLDPSEWQDLPEADYARYLPKNDKWKEKYKEPAGPDTSDLPKLPEGWVWVTPAQLGEVRLGRQRSPKNHTGPYMRPYLRAANATWDGVNLSDVMEMNFQPHEFETYQLREGDILLAEASGSADEVGKPFLWHEQIEGCCFQNTLIRVRLENLPPSYLYIHFLKDARTGRFGQISKGVGIHHLGAERLAEMPVALPPIAEQQRIVAEVERRLSVEEELEATVEANLKRAERLRQAILKRAFEGKLVPQDPEDEPASVLLERIQLVQK